MGRRRLWTLLLALAVPVAGVVFLAATSLYADETATASEPEAAPDPSLEAPGRNEVTALAEAYPGRIAETGFRDGDWALRMEGTWYYWANGRLLPAELREQADEFVGIRFYRYERGPLEEREIDEELERVLVSRTEAQASGQSDERLRFNSFLDELYQIDSSRAADTTMQRIRFLGRSTRVHPLLIEPLQSVERTILAQRPYDKATSEFIVMLGSIHGFNWRNIAGTQRRSYHSYGVAIDLVPRSYRGSWPYWLWAAEGGIDRWWELPLSDRWFVPQSIIDAFEDNGFIWGGKWLFFDNLHFEYRPESLIMADRRAG